MDGRDKPGHDGGDGGDGGDRRNSGDGRGGGDSGGGGNFGASGDIRLMRLLLNARHGTPGVVVLPAGGFRRAKAEITSWDGYTSTPLHDLPALAAKAGVAVVRLKDESSRFDLGSFKALGGAYAVAFLLSAELARRGVVNSAGSATLASGRHAEATEAITVTCATDGNHGRAVAWGLSASTAAA